MTADDFRALQAPLKEQYRSNPAAAQITLRASSAISDVQIACKLTTGKAIVEAGLHPATGGDGIAACSGDMLLEALVACAGVTIKAVSTAMNINLRTGHVHAEGDLDFRGTLGVSREAPVGFSAIRLRFDLQTDAPKEQVAKLIELTERYCVVYQTLRNSPQIQVTCDAAAP